MYTDSNLIRMNVLAEHFEDLGDYQMAERITTGIIELLTRHFGEDDRRLIEPWLNLGLLAEVQNRTVDSQNFLEQAQRLSGLHLESSHWLNKEIEFHLRELGRTVLIA